MKDLIAFIIEIDRGESAEYLWKNLSDYLLACGVRNIFYRHIPLIAEERFDTQYLYTKNLPESVIERYITEKVYESDILQMMAFTQGQTYNWFSDEVLKSAKESDILFANMLMKYMSDEILILPVYGTSIRSGYFYLSFNNARTEISESSLRSCQIACNYTHIKYSQYLTDKKTSADTLSMRELEIIRWVARGKSNSVISDIMGISRHTVDSYLRRIFVKMEVTNRTTAALKALSMGLIIP